MAGVSSPVLATVITASPVDFSAAEAANFSGAVATFTDDNPAATPADFNASIDWGDGTSPTAGTIGSSGAAFVVNGSHTYADEGSFTVTVTINDNAPGTGTATATDTATIAEADALSGTPVTFSAAAGTPFTGVVGNFTDTLPGNVAGDFTASINWGDASTSAGTVSGGSGAFHVSGTHTYAGTGTFTVTVTLSDDAPGTATATVMSTAHVGTTALSVVTVNISTQEHVAFNGTVATFTDSDTTKTPASFTSIVNWGDGTTTPGTITGGAGSFTVTGLHTYADEGRFTLGVTVNENPPGSSTAASTATATVSEADSLSGTPIVFSAIPASSFNGVVANFSDTDTGNPAGDFIATISWGDSTPATAGTVTGGGGTFHVSGTHTYAAVGTYSVTVTLSDDAPGTATATAISTSHVAFNQTITFTTTPPATPMVTGTYTVGATASSGLTVAFSIDATSTPGACTIAGNLVSFTGVGTCIVDANQPGNANYTAAPQVQQTMLIAKKTTTMTLTATPNPVITGAPVTLVATVVGDPPTGTVSFADNSVPLACSPVTLVVGATSSTATCTASFATAGTHSITATYSGDATFAQATAAVAVTIGVPAVPAPMLDRWAMLLLCGLLGAVVVVRIRRI